jgi:hypothetical protein
MATALQQAQQEAERLANAHSARPAASQPLASSPPPAAAAARQLPWFPSVLPSSVRAASQHKGRIR